VNTHLKLDLQIMDVDVEFKVVPVKVVACVVQQIIGLALHIIYNLIEGLDHTLKPYKTNGHFLS
jgi:hypothetical protein